ncbi:MAG: DUF2845 domain-containing protein, partial [Aeromonas veronii]
MSNKMKNVAGLALLLLSIPASADAMRCKNALISEGDSTAEMLLKCGEPM